MPENWYFQNYPFIVLKNGLQIKKQLPGYVLKFVSKSDLQTTLYIILFL
jgi:hypothetical protein